MEILLAIAHVVAATGVSIHVLLTHKEVRSSIGWIGLSWLSPFIGSSIYIAFGVNRVVRRAIKSGLDQNSVVVSGVTQAEFQFNAKTPANIVALGTAGDAISGLALMEGNSLELYENGGNAYPVMLRAVENAKHSIALAAYIFASDETGREFATKLVEAKARGVDVRVLVDGVGSGYFRAPIVTQLRDGGVSAEQFLHKWAPWAMTFINLRNHKKILIVDGQTGFTGGMNIADQNVSLNKEGPKVLDVHAQIRGPVVAQLLQTFEKDWEFTTSETLNGDIWWPNIDPDGDIAMRGITSGPDESVGQIESLFATAIAQARHRVRIVTPYFLPEDRLFEVIQRAAMRDVVVEILVPKKSNHFYFDWAMAAHLSTFSLEGIDCYQTTSTFDHSKLMSVDGQWGSIGSANWDSRSMRLNFEFQVELFGEEAVGEIDRLIDKKMQNGVLLRPEILEQRPLPVKLRDAATRLFLPYL